MSLYTPVPYVSDDDRIVQIFIDRDDMEVDEAFELREELLIDIQEGADPIEILGGLNLDWEYFQDLLPKEMVN